MKRIATFVVVGSLMLTTTIAHSMDDDDIEDVVTAGRPGVDLNHRELLTLKSEQVPSSFIRAANAASSLPLSHHFRVRERILKAGKFYQDSLAYTQTQLKLKPPFDLIALVIFFMVCSYIPTVLLTLVWHLLFGGKKAPTYNPEQYRYNAQDIQDINTILL